MWFRQPDDTSSKHLESILARRLKDVLKTSLKRLGDIWARRLEDFMKMSWRRPEDVWPRRIYWSWSRRLKDVLKTSSEDEWLRRIYSSWSRRLEDVLKTCCEDEDERRLQDVFKASSSGRKFAGNLLIQYSYLTHWIARPNNRLGQKQPPEVFLGISQSSQENTCARASFLIKLQPKGLQLY